MHLKLPTWEAALGEVKDFNSGTPELCLIVQQAEFREGGFLFSVLFFIARKRW